MATILVTGGAGYIGSHACHALARAGRLPVTFDDLSTGWAEAVRFGPLVVGDLGDAEALDACFAAHRPDAVIHFAARSDVAESVRDPGRYWADNVGGSLSLLRAMVRAGCGRIVFSSTCATYGDADGIALDEGTAQHPINAYGASKLAVEHMLRDFGAAHGIRSVIFRYFNVAGAEPAAGIGEFHRPETHLVPLVLDAIAGQREALTIHGTDYDTPDGTCVRVYVHVCDLVDAHLAGLERLLTGAAGGTFCLGTGHGFSVREVIAAGGRITNRPVPVVEGPRRAGDAVRLVCGSARARAELGWTPARSTLDRMMVDAWDWHRQEGYTR